MDTVYKSLDIKQLTAEGQIEAVISTFGRDRDGDVMTRDAFKGSDGKSIPMVWSHNWDMPIGKGVVSVGDNGAKFTGQFFLETRDGEDAYKRVKAMGDLQEYSIGFRIKDAALGYEEDETGERIYTRTIKDLELFEASPVLVGAAYNTGTVAIKTAKEDIHEQLKALKEQHDTSCELGDACPLAEEHKAGEEPDKDDREGYIDPDRLKGLRDLEAALGYRPLIADRS